MKRSNSSEYETQLHSSKKRRLTSDMFKLINYFEPIDEVIEISDDDERELSPADR
jgi:hypothetical protein